MLYFDEYGNRGDPTLVLLHGAGALDTFCQQYYLAERYHLVVPHLPGAGQSAETAYEPEKAKQELFQLIEHLHAGPIGVIGHSLGAQIAIMLVCERPELFSFAVFLSAWVNPRPQTVKRYCRMAGMAAKLLRYKWLTRLQGRYWHYTKEQAERMAQDSTRITPQVYRSFFEHTLDLQKLASYPTARVPMVAICGSKEVRDMRRSLQLLGQNPHCQTIVLPGANHDFPMRRAEQFNPVLEEILARYR